MLGKAPESSENNSKDVNRKDDLKKKNKEAEEKKGIKL